MLFLACFRAGKKGEVEVLIFLFRYFLESPIEEVTDALYGKWRSFMMTHNVELKMPDMIFDGATFRITPRAFEGDGALVKLEMIPRSLEEARTGGRFLLKKISKLLLSKYLPIHLAFASAPNTAFT